MKVSLPLVIFEVTSRCNLNCRYCYNVWKIPGQETLIKDSYSGAIKTLKRLFRIADIRQVTFTGGEPLMAERIEELILFARLKKKNVGLITNGSAGNPERYRLLHSMGVSVFEIPLHAHLPEIHDQITRTPGSWAHSVESIQYLKSQGAHVVPVIVATRINLPYLGETLEYINALGCGQIMLNRYNIGGEGLKENPQILPSAEALRKGWAIADALAGRLQLRLSSNVCTPWCLLNPQDYPQITFGRCAARPDKLPVTIDTEGNLRLCNHSPVVAGNIFHQSLTEIFASPHVTGWLKEKPAFCHDCAHYAQCLGGCRAAALQAGLGPEHADPVVTSAWQTSGNC